MKYHGIVIADLHIGAFSIEKLYQEFRYGFIDKIKEMKKINYIIFCGDVFDHKLFLNEKESYYAVKMIQELIDVCPEDIKIRFVYGTESHECNQYSILSTFRNKDLRIIKNVEEEELFPDFHVLYLPEEYVNDKYSYYNSYFQNKKKYNYIFGHGMIREGMKIASVQEEAKQNNRKKVPIFSTAELNNMCKGETYFGHYHIHTDLSPVYYIGSFSRWKFGEEEEKGFYILEYDSKKETYNKEFIQNELAENFKTFRYGYDNKLFQDMDKLEENVNHIEKIIKSDTMDHIRFQFNIPSSLENPEFLMEYIENRFRYYDNIKINFVNGYIKEKRKKESEEIKKENDKYGFIFDKDMKFENKTAYFIQIEYNKEIPVERVYMYLYEPLEKILAEKEE